MDFIIGLPKSWGKNVITVAIDRLTNYAHLCALSHPFSSSTVDVAFMEIVQKIIVSDIDLVFKGKFGTELFSCLQTQLAHSSSCHPQYDGKIEILNKCLEGYPHWFASYKQT